MFKKLRSITSVFVLLACSILIQAEPLKESVTGAPVDQAFINQGKTLFTSKCASCHALNSKLVGPALKDVTKRRSHEWLKKWISNNEALRKSGDADANKIFEEYGKSVMSNFPDLKDADLNAIIMYIEEMSVNPPVAKGNDAPKEAAPADPVMVKKVNWWLFVLFFLFIALIILIGFIVDKISDVAKNGKEAINWNQINAVICMVFLVLGLVATFWETSIHSKLLLPESASEHGVNLDKMFNITLFFTGIVFFITQILLFLFAYLYRGREGRKATYFSHSNKLEMIWTIIPAIVLTALVVYGVKNWRSITNEKSSNEVELFAYQFGWSARYPGADGKLGNSNYNLISGTNALGVAIQSEAEQLLIDLSKDTADMYKQIDSLPYRLGALKSSLGGLVGEDRKMHLQKICDIESGVTKKEIEDLIYMRIVQMSRIRTSLKPENIKNVYTQEGKDDIVSNEIHLPVNKMVTLKLRARDVIHSAYLPYFRVQMNVVPGLPTTFSFKPTITTNEMRIKLGKPDFDYHVVCAKICGNAHFNMKMKVVIDSEADYKKWVATQAPTFMAPIVTEPAKTEPSDSNNKVTPKLITLK